MKSGEKLCSVLETFQKRLKALKAKSAQDILIFTAAQLKGLEKAKQEEEEVQGESLTRLGKVPRQ